MSSQLLLPIAEQTGPASAWKRHLSEATKRSVFWPPKRAAASFFGIQRGGPNLSIWNMNQIPLGEKLTCPAEDWLAVLLGPAISVPFATCYAALICGDATMHAYFPIVLQHLGCLIWPVCLNLDVAMLARLGCNR